MRTTCTCIVGHRKSFGSSWIGVWQQQRWWKKHSHLDLFPPSKVNRYEEYGRS